MERLIQGLAAAGLLLAAVAWTGVPAAAQNTDPVSLFRSMLDKSNHLQGQKRAQHLGDPVTKTWDMFFFPSGRVLRIVRTRSRSPRTEGEEIEREAEWGTFSLDRYENSISFYFADEGRSRYTLQAMPLRQSVQIGQISLETVEDYGVVGRGFEEDAEYRIRDIQARRRGGESGFRSVPGDSDTSLFDLRLGNFSRSYTGDGGGVLVATLPEPGDYVLYRPGGPASGEADSEAENGDDDSGGIPPPEQEQSNTGGSVTVLGTFRVGGSELNWRMADQKFKEGNMFGPSRTDDSSQN